MNNVQVLPAHEPAIKHLRSQTNPPHRILVVDDDDSMRRLNSTLLLRAGYEVDVAEDGAAAWDALCADGYDLLITDNNMPNLSGLELLEKLHSSRMDLPVIMATGTVPEEEFIGAPWLKPSAMLLKPYSNAEMLRTVKKVLREAGGKAEKLASAGRPAGVTRPGPVNSARRILVVDEDIDLRLLYADALTPSGYHVDCAEDGATAWERLRGNGYDLLITEHDLPTLTGLELIRMVRAARLALPVVMVAGSLPAYELVQDPSLRIVATLEKPFAVDTLLDTVRNVLGAANNLSVPIDQLPNWRNEPTARAVRL